MRRWLSGLTLNQKLAVAAFTLGLVALAAKPVAHNGLVLNSRDMDTLVTRGIDAWGRWTSPTGSSRARAASG